MLMMLVFSVRCGMFDMIDDEDSEPLCQKCAHHQSLLRDGCMVSDVAVTSKRSDVIHLGPPAT